MAVVCQVAINIERHLSLNVTRHPRIARRRDHLTRWLVCLWTYGIVDVCKNGMPPEV